MKRYLLGILAAATLVASAAGCSGRGARPGAAATETRLTVFALGELRGQIEPCGCTTDPLGDLARTAELVDQARAKGPVIVVDTGSLLYAEPVVADQARPQEDLKADLIATIYRDQLAVAAVGLGPDDLAAGPSKLRLPREVANLPASSGVPLEAPKVIEVGDERIGVFGVVDPTWVPSLGATDPTEAARQAIAGLKQQKATRIIALATMSKKDGVAIARAVPGIDLLVIGTGVEAPPPDKVIASPEQVGGTMVITPTDRGQVVARVDLVLRGPGPLVDAVGADAAPARRKELDARVAHLDEQLAAWKADPTADAAFVAARQKERDDLAAESAALADNPERVPAHGSYFELAQIRIAKILSCDTRVVLAKQEYTRAAGAANVAAAAAIPPVPVPKGTATYVGAEACADCHQEAYDFWKKTRHARAWETIEKVDKQFDYDCTSCHVTGWAQPGGASMKEVAAGPLLHDVQCETCHGPGSIHVDADDKDAKKTIRRTPPPDLCASQCHTPIHSDTFDRVAYLRDILGPGHGEHAAKELGPGVTGAELRKAGLAKAGAMIGAGCPK
ncbi:MAG TPA: multiheme c-type cytochrome [Kofleriaceae bacterium]|nr:multiheme c-type cytochrome [Kofleriaceae bacterium]